MDPSVLFNQFKTNASSLARGNLGVPILLLMILGMMTLPIPPFLLDAFFTFNIALAIVVLLVSVYSLRPLDFAVFPSILLVATLLRLALNVASTRVVLLEGHNGGDAAGKVIEAFGEVVIGGNYAVGLVVFLILVIINFVVITKGAGRVSEVSARFTLDAMPGKQMAIDADLNGGLIDAEQAKLRRSEVAAEADFYGSMDGASKFVKGDAIAGILILVINVIGGLTVGMVQHELDFNTAIENYVLLTIGDGLVAQIPGLLLSVAAAIMVTRTSSSAEMGTQVYTQMFKSPKSLSVASGLMITLGLVPGMPHVAFLGLGVIAGSIAYFIYKRNQQSEVVVLAEEEAQAEAALEHKQEETKEVDWEDVSPVDMVGLEVGYRLIPMVDKTQGGQLIGRIKGVRKKLSQEMGFLMPTVHVRDNLDLLPNAYRISLMGVPIAECEVYPEKDMAISPGQVFGTVTGIETVDPAFGLDAVWIDADQKEHAQTLGYTVVDCSTVVATHLNQVLQTHAHELLGHEEVEQWLELLRKSAPKLADELVPNTVTNGILLKVLQGLLIEQLSIKDMRTIAESLANLTPKSQDPAALLAAVRDGLSRSIVQNINGHADEIEVFTLDQKLEQLLQNTVQQSKQLGQGSDHIVMEPSLAEKLKVSVTEAAQKQEIANKPGVLLVSSPVRPMLAKFFRTTLEHLHVLSYPEIPETKQITIVNTIGQ